jgi:hypothetical protein
MRLPSFPGAPIALPPAIDRGVERWAAAPPRARQLIAALLVAVALVGVQWRIGAADRRWGGDPIDVLVASVTGPVGTAPQVARRALPPAAVPPGALSELPPGALLAFALPEGSVLTRAHLDARGPGVGLPPGFRAVPVPVEESWSIAAGAWVDVWALPADTAPAQLVAGGRPVLEVRTGTRGTTALVGIADSELAAVTTALGQGRVLLAHAPAPG